MVSALAVVIIVKNTKLTCPTSVSIVVHGTSIYHTFDHESPAELLILILLPLPEHDDGGLDARDNEC